MKVSREGVVLIKSFEGFRASATRDADGGWVIGYGHRLTAREGLTVSEADAELLLQYDLIPIVKALNAAMDEGRIPTLNAHQFDALASFALSVGIDTFLSSDVLETLGRGATGEAADAFVHWPQPTSPEDGLRRRLFRVKRRRKRHRRCGGSATAGDEKSEKPGQQSCHRP